MRGESIRCLRASVFMSKAEVPEQDVSLLQSKVITNSSDDEDEEKGLSPVNAFCGQHGQLVASLKHSFLGYFLGV